MSNRKNRIFIMSKNVVNQKAKQSIDKLKKKSKRKYIFTEVISRVPNKEHSNKIDANPIQESLQKKSQNYIILAHQNTSQKLFQGTTQKINGNSLKQTIQHANSKRLNSFLESIKKKENQSANNSKRPIINNQSKIHRRLFTQSGRKRINLFCRYESPNNQYINYSMPKSRRRIFSENSNALHTQTKKQNILKGQLKSIIKEQQQKKSSKIHFSREHIK